MLVSFFFIFWGLILLTVRVSQFHLQFRDTFEGESWETKTWSWWKWMARLEALLVDSDSPKMRVLTEEMGQTKTHETVFWIYLTKIPWGEGFFEDQNRTYSRMVQWRVLSHLCHFISLLVLVFSPASGEEPCFYGGQFGFRDDFRNRRIWQFSSQDFIFTASQLLLPARLQLDCFFSPVLTKDFFLQMIG